MRKGKDAAEEEKNEEEADERVTTRRRRRQRQTRQPRPRTMNLTIGSLATADALFASGVCLLDCSNSWCSVVLTFCMN